MSDIPYFLTETASERALRFGYATPRFLQGAFPFAGRGLFELTSLDDALTYTVPADCFAQIVYFRAGNASSELIYFALAVNGVPVRYFPVGAGSDLHVPLAISEKYGAGATISVLFAAPRNLSGTVIVDTGIMETRKDGGK